MHNQTHRAHKALTVCVGVLCLLMILPLSSMVLAWGQGYPQEWAHLKHYVLPTVISNTVILLIGVGSGVAVLGISLAWLTTMCEFPLRRWLSVVLVLPLALPAYVVGFVYVGLFDYSGTIPTWWRNVLGPSPVFEYLPHIRSLFGAVLVLVLALYPYVYLITRQAFLIQGAQAIEVSRSMGVSPWRAFFKSALPLSRPWWMGGIALALMETFADFGTVSVFNIHALTTAIYGVWLGYFNPSLALQLTSTMIVVVFVLMFLQQRGEAAKRFAWRATHNRRIQLYGGRAWLATLFCALVGLSAFMLPLWQLLVWGWSAREGMATPRFWDFVRHSLVIASSSAVLIGICAVLLAFAHRASHQFSMSKNHGTVIRLMIAVANLGYGIPGMVLALGFMMAIGFVRAHFDTAAPYWAWLGDSAWWVLMLALLVRFMSVAYQPLQSSIKRIMPSWEESAQSMGIGPWQRLKRIHLPLLRGAMGTALLMVFVDVMKEMPITLMARPFDWDTLSVRIYSLTAEGLWTEAALPSLMLVVVGMIPVLVLLNQSKTSKQI